MDHWPGKVWVLCECKGKNNGREFCFWLLYSSIPAVRSALRRVILTICTTVESSKSSNITILLVSNLSQFGSPFNIEVVYYRWKGFEVDCTFFLLIEYMYIEIHLFHVFCTYDYTNFILRSCVLNTLELQIILQEISDFYSSHIMCYLRNYIIFFRTGFCNLVIVEVSSWNSNHSLIRTLPSLKY